MAATFRNTAEKKTSTRTSSSLMRAIILLVTVLILGECSYYLWNQTGHGRSIQTIIGFRDAKTSSSVIMTLNHTSQLVVPTSREFVSALDETKCRFPIYFDERGRVYRLNDDGDNGYVRPTTDWKDIAKTDVGAEDADAVMDTMGYAAYLRRKADRKQRGHHHHRLPKVKRNVTFVHIGKWCRPGILST